MGIMEVDEGSNRPQSTRAGHSRNLKQIAWISKSSCFIPTVVYFQRDLNWRFAGATLLSHTHWKLSCSLRHRAYASRSKYGKPSGGLRQRWRDRGMG
jgi:hypothetical protein